DLVGDRAGVDVDPFAVCRMGVSLLVSARVEAKREQQRSDEDREAAGLHSGGKCIPVAPARGAAAVLSEQRPTRACRVLCPVRGSCGAGASTWPPAGGSTCDRRTP